MHEFDRFSSLLQEWRLRKVRGRVGSSSKETLSDPLGSDGCEVDLEGTSEWSTRQWWLWGRPRRNLSVIYSAVMAVSVGSTSKEPLSDPLGNDGCSTLDQRHSYVLGVRKQTKILTAVICLIYFMRTLVSVFLHLDVILTCFLLWSNVRIGLGHVT